MASLSLLAFVKGCRADGHCKLACNKEADTGHTVQSTLHPQTKRAPASVGRHGHPGVWPMMQADCRRGDPFVHN